MLASITTFYSPGDLNPIRMQKLNLEQKGRPRKLDRTEEPYQSPILSAGQSDWAKTNLLYKSLTRSLDIDEQDNSDLMDSFWNITGIEIRSPIFRDEDEDMIQERRSFSEVDELLADPRIADAIYLRVVQKWSLPSIWAKLSINDYQLRDIFRLI